MKHAMMCANVARGLSGRLAVSMQATPAATAAKVDSDQRDDNTADRCTTANGPSFQRSLGLQYLSYAISQGWPDGDLILTAPSVAAPRLRMLFALFDMNGDGRLDVVERDRLLWWLDTVQCDEP
jgi:hypothetical protein